MTDQTVIEVTDAEEVIAPDAQEIADLMAGILADGLDHPEVWSQLGIFLDHLPELPAELAGRLNYTWNPQERTALILLLVMCYAVRGQIAYALEQIEPVAIEHSQSALVQGALFHIQGLADPDNPKFDLADRFCATPFQKFDVLDGSTHLCCASWLSQSAGNLGTASRWEDVWNSPAAQSIRASIFDGSFRY